MRNDITFVPNSVVEGKKIQMIKAIRGLTSMGLKDSKHIADDLHKGFESTVPFNLVADCNEKNLISDLKSLGVKVIMGGKEGVIKMMDNVKECIALCTESEEPELLEVFSVAFKMLCEK
jgi:hypothetical protein